MSLMRSTVPLDGWLGQHQPTESLQGATLRSLAPVADHRLVSFRAQLLQQMLGSLDHRSMSVQEALSLAGAFTTNRVISAGSKLSTPFKAHALNAGTPPVQTAMSRRQGRQVTTPTLTPRLVDPVPDRLSASEPVPPSAVPGAAVSPKTSPAETFLSKLAGVAQATADTLGLSPHLLLAHAALETGWGRKVIKDQSGQDSYNLFGIKAGGQWTGKTMEVRTTEYVHGVAETKVASFRAYASYAEAFSDYARLIKHRYGEAVVKGATAEGFGRALQAKGYATDPDYARKIARVAQSVAYRLTSQPSGNVAVA